MKWTTEKRYKRYEDWSEAEKEQLKSTMEKSPWRAKYHVEPSSGLLNDPNGFSYFDGKWILFYQNFPFGAAHGLKSWVQLESDNLVTFKETGVKVLPDTPLDSHGAYSGSAMQFGDQLFLFYTGNVRDENWVRHPYQLGALMDKDGHIEKHGKDLIPKPSDATDHFRDPQIFQYKDHYYAIVGGQNLAKKGFVRLYRSVNNDYTNWEEIGDLDFKNDNTAYMMECPNLVFVDDKPVLIYCPQGLDKDVFHYDNIYPNLYKIGETFDPENATITPVSKPHQLDYGFDVYATQAFNAPDGRALCISWLGLPDVSYPSDIYEHQGILSLVKELSIKNGKLYQTPVKGIEKLRQSSLPFNKYIKNTSNCYELNLKLKGDMIHELVLFSDKDGNGLSLIFNLVDGEIVVDRSNVGEAFATEYSSVRTAPIAPADTTARIFIDNSVFEIFVNDGEMVFSGRVFPRADQTHISILQGDPTGVYYPLLSFTNPN